MYRPKTGAIVSWYWQGSRPGDPPAIQTTFTDTGDLRQWTPAGVLARYGDPRPALRKRAADVAPAGNIEELVASPTSYTYFRFVMDPEKGELPGLIRVAAGDRFNRWWLEELSGVLAFQQSNDFVACESISELRALYGHLLGVVGTLPSAPTTPPIVPTVPPSNDSEINSLRAELASAKSELEEAADQLDSIAEELDMFDDLIPEAGRGKYAEAGRKFIAKLRKILARL